MFFLTSKTSSFKAINKKWTFSARARKESKRESKEVNTAWRIDGSVSEIPVLNNLSRISAKPYEHPVIVSFCSASTSNLQLVFAASFLTALFLFYFIKMLYYWKKN